jgi:alpha-tubulin suppressor-like RCC1 family protein
MNTLRKVPAKLAAVGCLLALAAGGIWLGVERRQTPLAKIATIAAGSSHSIVLRADGTVWTFGGNVSGQLGYDTADRFENADPPKKQTGIFDEIKKRLGLGDNPPDIQKPKDPFPPHPAPHLVERNALAVAAGTNHTAILKRDGTIWTFGSNTNGQLGYVTKSEDFNPVPKQVPLLTEIIELAAGGTNTVALKNDGTVWIFGSNNDGQLGDPADLGNHPTPKQIRALTNIIAVRAGGRNVVALKADKTVWFVGGHYWLKDGMTEVESSTPMQIPGLTDITTITAGYEHTVGIQRDGTVWAIGASGRGQRGSILTRYRDNFVVAPISAMLGAVDVAAASEHTLVISSDGTLWAFGKNDGGSLGPSFDANCECIPRPEQVPGLTDVVAVAAGERHTLVLKRDGSVWTFGFNGQGELGYLTDQFESNPTPKQVL